MQGRAEAAEADGAVSRGTPMELLVAVGAAVLAVGLLLRVPRRRPRSPTIWRPRALAGHPRPRRLEQPENPGGSLSSGTNVRQPGRHLNPATHKPGGARRAEAASAGPGATGGRLKGGDFLDPGKTPEARTANDVGITADTNQRGAGHPRRVSSFGDVEGRGQLRQVLLRRPAGAVGVVHRRHQPAGWDQRPRDRPPVPAVQTPSTPTACGRRASTSPRRSGSSPCCGGVLRAGDPVPHRGARHAARPVSLRRPMTSTPRSNGLYFSVATSKDRVLRSFVRMLDADGALAGRTIGVVDVEEHRLGDRRPHVAAGARAARLHRRLPRPHRRRHKRRPGQIPIEVRPGCGPPVSTSRAAGVEA